MQADVALRLFLLLSAWSGTWHESNWKHFHPEDSVVSDHHYHPRSSIVAKDTAYCEEQTLCSRQRFIKINNSNVQQNSSFPHNNANKYLEFNFPKFILILKKFLSVSNTTEKKRRDKRTANVHIWKCVYTYSCPIAFIGQHGVVAHSLTASAAKQNVIINSPHAVNWLAKFIIRLFTTNIIIRLTMGFDSLSVRSDLLLDLGNWKPSSTSNGIPD